MSGYIASFWTIFSVLLVISGVLIWLSVIKSRDNKMIQTGFLGLRYLVSQYLQRVLQKTVYVLLKIEGSKGLNKKGTDIRLNVNQGKWVNSYTDPVSRELLLFARGMDVAQAVHDQVSLPTLDAIDIFVLPDVLIQRAGPSFYSDLLRMSHKIVMNDSALVEPYTADESREYLIGLVDHFKKKKNTSPIVRYNEEATTGSN